MYCIHTNKNITFFKFFLQRKTYIFVAILKDQGIFKISIIRFLSHIEAFGFKIHINKNSIT